MCAILSRARGVVERKADQGERPTAEPWAFGGGIKFFQSCVVLFTFVQALSPEVGESATWVFFTHVFFLGAIIFGFCVATGGGHPFNIGVLVRQKRPWPRWRRGRPRSF